MNFMMFLVDEGDVLRGCRWRIGLVCERTLGAEDGYRLSRCRISAHLLLCLQHLMLMNSMTFLRRAPVSTQCRRTRLSVLAEDDTLTLGMLHAEGTPS